LTIIPTGSILFGDDNVSNSKSFKLILDQGHEVYCFSWFTKSLISHSQNTVIADSRRRDFQHTGKFWL